MGCFMIGCKSDPQRDMKWELPLQIKNCYGALICTKIQGCKDHYPCDIFKIVTSEQKLRDGGH